LKLNGRERRKKKMAWKKLRVGKSSIKNPKAKIKKKENANRTSQIP
jgi:hypothetical protein